MLTMPCVLAPGFAKHAEVLDVRGICKEWDKDDGALGPADRHDVGGVAELRGGRVAAAFHL